MVVLGGSFKSGLPFFMAHKLNLDILFIIFIFNLKIKKYRIMGKDAILPIKGYPIGDIKFEDPQGNEQSYHIVMDEKNKFFLIDAFILNETDETRIVAEADTMGKLH